MGSCMEWLGHSLHGVRTIARSGGLAHHALGSEGCTEWLGHSLQGVHTSAMSTGLAYPVLGSTSCSVWLGCGLLGVQATARSGGLAHQVLGTGDCTEWLGHSLRRMSTKARIEGAARGHKGAETKKFVSKSFVTHQIVSCSSVMQLADVLTQHGFPTGNASIPREAGQKLEGEPCRMGGEEDSVGEARWKQENSLAHQNKSKDSVGEARWKQEDSLAHQDKPKARVDFNIIHLNAACHALTLIKRSKRDEALVASLLTRIAALTAIRAPSSELLSLSPILRSMGLLKFCPQPKDLGPIHKKILSPSACFVEYGAPHEQEHSFGEYGAPHEQEHSFGEYGAPHEQEHSFGEYGAPHEQEHSFGEYGAPHEQEHSFGE
eukprot:gene3582-13665_t